MKRLIVFIILFTGGQYANATAGNFISQAFDDVMINSAGGGSSSSRNGAFSGPQLSYRTPITEVSLGHITPPSFSYGCNGMDMNFGAFSFITEDELKNLMKGVVAAAPGYAFGLAIDAMCGNCFSAMKSLAKDVNDMMKSLKNSCQLTESLFSSLKPEVDENGKKSKSSKKEHWWGSEAKFNKFRSGAFNGLRTFMTDTIGISNQFPLTGDNYAVENGVDTESPEEMACEDDTVRKVFTHNVVWDVLNDNDAFIESFGALFGSDHDKTKRFVMSFLGTTVWEYKGESSTDCTKDSRDEEIDGMDFNIFLKTQEVEIFECDNVEFCWGVTSTETESYEIVSPVETIKGYINDIITKNQAWNASAALSDSADELEADTLAWLSYEGGNLAAHLVKSGDNWVTWANFYSENAELLAIRMINSYMTEFLEVLELTSNELAGDMSNEATKDRINAKKAEQAKWYADFSERLDTFDESLRQMDLWLMNDLKDKAFLKTN